MSGRRKDSSYDSRLQIWCDGKNHTRYIRPKELPAIHEVLGGRDLFKELVDKCANLVVAETRQRMDDPAKKKTLRYTSHSKTNSPGSSSPS